MSESGAANEHLVVATKLNAPRVRREVVPRKHLLDRLAQAVSLRQLCVLSAPAGFGKTTTLVQWLDSAPYRFAWFSIDEEDNDYERFWRHLHAAVDQLWPGTAERADVRLTSRSGTDTTFLDVLVNQIAAQAFGDDLPAILVLDDYHLVHSKELHDSLAYLLDHLPQQVVPFIATREDPPLGMARRRARGTLAELRATDLRFSPAETSSLFNDVMGLALSPQQIATLDERTEGWAASLHLAALSLQKRSDPSEFIRSFAGSDRHVVDYLMEEVLARQDEHVVAFLLGTSVLERFCASLCDDVLGAFATDDSFASQRMLEQLERANLFLVPLDDERKWYRYHHLFADLLRLRLRRRHADQLPGVHLRASSWYERHGHTGSAIRHALKAKDESLAAELIERHGMTHITRMGRAVPQRWLRSIPERLFQNRPMLALVDAWSTLVRQPMLMADPDDLAAVEHRLSHAENALQQGDHEAQTEASCRNSISMCRAHLARYRGEVDEAIERSEAELGRLPTEPSLFRSGTAFNLGLAQLAKGNPAAAANAFAEAERSTTADNHFIGTGIAYMRALVLMRSGRLREGYAICNDVLDRFSPEDELRPFPSYAGSHFVGRGRVLMEWNQTRDAETQLRTGIHHIERAGDPLIESNARGLLARLLFAGGDVERAEAELTAILRRLPAAAPLVQAVRLDAGAATEEVDLGDWAERAAARYEPVVARGEWPFLLWLAQARRLVPDRIGGFSEAEASTLTDGLKEQVRRADEDGWHDRALEVLVVLALAHAARDDSTTAFARLERALHLAHAEGYVRRFISAGPPMARLLYKYLQVAKAADEPLARYASKLLGAFPDVDGASADESPAPAPSGEDAALVEPLTEREREVLDLIAHGHTNQEIADHLFISYETVKVHARNIYQKLDVRGRTEAAARARALGILGGE